MWAYIEATRLNAEGVRKFQPSGWLPTLGKEVKKEC